MLRTKVSSNVSYALFVENELKHDKTPESSSNSITILYIRKDVVGELGNLTNTWGKYGVSTARISSVSGQYEKELGDRKRRISYAN